MAVTVNMARRSDDEIISTRPSFRSGRQHFNSSTNIPETLEAMKQKITESFATYTSGGSGWVFQSIENLLLKIDKNIPLNGGSYIDLPVVIKSWGEAIMIYQKKLKPKKL